MMFGSLVPCDWSTERAFGSGSPRWCTARRESSERAGADRESVANSAGLDGTKDGEHAMDDRRARFRARVQLHVRDGWEVVQLNDEPGTPLSALVTKVTIGQP